MALTTIFVPFLLYVNFNQIYNNKRDETETKLRFRSRFYNLKRFRFWFRFLIFEFNRFRNTSFKPVLKRF